MRGAVSALIESVFQAYEAKDASSAVSKCIRIARHRNDYHSFAFFTFLLENAPKEGRTIIEGNLFGLGIGAADSIASAALERALNVRKISELDREALGRPKVGEEVFYVGANSIDDEICLAEDQLASIRNSISREDSKNPFNQINSLEKLEFQLLSKRGFIKKIKARMLSSCFLFASQLERETSAEEAPEHGFSHLNEDLFSGLRQISEAAHDQFLVLLNACGSESAEERTHALTSARRLLKELADFLMPAGPIEGLTDEKYLNRIAKYLEEQYGFGWRPKLSIGNLEILLKYVNQRSSKGVHASVSKKEALEVLLLNYLLLPPILDAYIFSCGSEKMASE